MQNILKLDSLWLVLTAGIVFVLTVITNGWAIFGDNTTGFRLGSLLTVILAIAGLLRSFNQMHGSLVLQLMIRGLAAILIGLVALWNYLGWIGV